MPTLTQLRYILALHRNGHFGRAAAECSVSQPTLSGQLAKAEDELGVVLFDRRAKPVAATEHGRRVVRLAREVLAAHQRLVDSADGASEVSGDFTLGIIPTLAPYVLPWFVKPFAEAFPNVRLTVLERTTDDIVRAIRAMRVDAGLVATPLDEAGVVGRTVFYDPFYIYARQGDPLLAHGEVDVAELDGRGLWLLEDGHCFRNQVIHLCGLQARTLFSNVRFEAGSFETLRGLIDRLGGCTLIPESYARTLPVDVRLACVRPFRGPTPTRELGLVTHRSQWKTDILDALHATLRTHAPRSLPRVPEGTVVVPAVG